MKKITKILSLVLCFAMIAGVCACGKGGKVANEDPDTVPTDTYEINWYMLGTAQKDVASVENAINDYLKDKINATVKITAMDAGQYKQKMSTMISASEYFDILRKLDA